MLTCNDIFSQDGLLSRTLENYECRSQQVEMAMYIEEAISEISSLLVEAGTGTGKSLAYLAPAVLSGRLPVIISTHTINLQNQLVQKDIPLVGNILGRNINSLLLKGRNNYVCLRKMQEINRDGMEATLFNRDEVKKNLTIFAKILSCGTGDREKIPFSVPKSLWQEISSDSETCHRSKCTCFNNCYFYATRKRMGEAELLVTNHALFFRELMPRIADEEQGCGAVIFDEAHHLFRSALDHFTRRINPQRITKLTRYLSRLILKKDDSGETSETAVKTGATLADIDRLTKAYFSDISAVSGNFRREKLEQDQLRFKKLSEIHTQLNLAYDRIKSLVEQGNLVLENLEIIERLSELSEDVACFLEFDTEENIFFMEKNDTSVDLKAARTCIADLLDENLFSRSTSFILTSATLNTGDNFTFIRKQLGLPQTVKCLQLDSPFNMKKQAILYVPGAIPEVDNADFLKEASLELESLLAITSGRAFILFTSYNMLERFWHYLSDPLRAQGYYPLCQGTYSREVLINDFKSVPKSVLFGTSSFWEGVDVPGDDLSLVVVMRLPFSVPSDPVHKRQCELIRESGGKPFTEFSLPEAILRLKQGFGRLIRTSTDHGILAVMDRRIVSKWYGKTIRKSLPDLNVTESVDQARHFFRESL